MQIGGGTSILAQIGPNFGQVTLEAMSEGGLKGTMIRQLDRNSGHSNTIMVKSLLKLDKNGKTLSHWCVVHVGKVVCTF